MNTNILALIALCNEYCSAVENCAGSTREEFVASMLRLLPRIYISASDIPQENIQSGGYIDGALEEVSYDNVRRNMETVMADADTYLEVFDDDMKYSDTPITATVSESLADLFQVMYNFLETVRDAPEELVDEAVAAFAEDFYENWSRTLCNVMRPLNDIRRADLFNY